jgi:hypothetical protein
MRSSVQFSIYEFNLNFHECYFLGIEDFFLYKAHTTKHRQYTQKTENNKKSARNNAYIRLQERTIGLEPHRTIYRADRCSRNGVN